MNSQIEQAPSLHLKRPKHHPTCKKKKKSQSNFIYKEKDNHKGINKKECPPLKGSISHNKEQTTENQNTNEAIIKTNIKLKTWLQVKLLTQKVTLRHAKSLLRCLYWHLLQEGIHLLANPLEKAYCTGVLLLHNSCSVYGW